MDLTQAMRLITDGRLQRVESRLQVVDYAKTWEWQEADG
jgi:hypothetical protein